MALPSSLVGNSKVQKRKKLKLEIGRDCHLPEYILEPGGLGPTKKDFLVFLYFFFLLPYLCLLFLFLLLFFLPHSTFPFLLSFFFLSLLLPFFFSLGRVLCIPDFSGTHFISEDLMTLNLDPLSLPPNIPGLQVCYTMPGFSLLFLLLTINNPETGLIKHERWIGIKLAKEINYQPY